LRATSARVAFAVSLLVHAALIVKIPIDIPVLVEEPKSEPPLQVRIAPPPVVPPSVAPSPPPVVVPRTRPRVVPPPVAPAPKPPAPAAATAPAPKVLIAPTGDLSSDITARQKDRAAAEEPGAKPSPSPPAEDAEARANRIAAANLAPPQFLTFGSDPTRSGGVFHVTRLSLDYGEFQFYGWNIDMGRRTLQQIEVQRGTTGDIRLAMVRKMIEIIRHYQPVEFTWESQRLGRSVTLSSLPRDNSGLEDFMMLEMFGQ
jgi:hypothetical protein